MLTVAYLANQFPAAVEPYVTEEIEELRRLGIRVVTGTVVRARKGEIRGNPDIVLRPVRGLVLARAMWLAVLRWNRIRDLVVRVLFQGEEGPIQRGKALLHTVLGACYAARLEGHEVEHIHVHHGFSGSWIAMVAARLLDLDFSVTLHGSDLLLHRAYLDVKLRNCALCLTISEYNRRFIATHYPEVELAKVVTARLGVEIPETETPKLTARRNKAEPFRILAIGRLHAVKDHAFLVQACSHLQAQKLDFHCEIAGDGPERRRLESMIREFGLERRVVLVGHIPPEQTDVLYRRADLIVLTSRSEGIPLVLMEAMALGKLVLAPEITGIPELVIPGKTGFLYQPGSMTDFLEQVMEIACLLGKTPLPTQTTHEKSSTGDGASFPKTKGSSNQLNWIRHAARVQVCHNFERKKNLQSFIDIFLRRVCPPPGKDLPDASSILQQI